MLPICNIQNRTKKRQSKKHKRDQKDVESRDSSFGIKREKLTVQINRKIYLLGGRNVKNVRK